MQSICVCVCLIHSLCLCVDVSFTLSVSLCLCVDVSCSLSVCLCVSHSLCLSLCVCVLMSHAVYLCRCQVENFTVSLSDGRALCYLVHHYNSSVLGRHLIRDQTCLSRGVSRSSLDDPQPPTTTHGHSSVSVAPDVDQLLANEKHNFRLLQDSVSIQL